MIMPWGEEVTTGVGIVFWATVGYDAMMLIILAAVAFARWRGR